MIFLHRKQSVLPFTSDLPPGSTLELLQQVLETSSSNSSNNTDNSGSNSHASPSAQPDAAAAAGLGPGSLAAAAAAGSGPLRVRAEHQQQLGHTLATVTAVQAAGTLLSVGFETIFEYLKVAG